MTTADANDLVAEGVTSAWNWLTAIPAWQAKAACRGLGPDEFFQVREDGNNAVSAVAKRVCAQCPVLAECLDYGLDDGGGIWGGVGGNQRRAFHRAKPSRAHEDPRERPGCACTWCELIRQHLARLDGNEAALITSYGPGASHGRRATYNRGCRCLDGGCSWSASAMGQALARAGVDTSTHWGEWAEAGADYEVARDVADIAAGMVLADELGPLFAWMAGADVGVSVTVCESFVDERLAVERERRARVAEVDGHPVEPIALPPASPVKTGHPRTMAA